MEDPKNFKHSENPTTIVSKKLNYIYSSAIWFCTFSLGLVNTLPASSAQELTLKYETDLSTISKSFSIITISYIFGAILIGVAYNYLNRQILSAISLGIMGTAMIILPQTPNLQWFFIIAGIYGFTSAGYDCAQIVWMIEMWGSKSKAFIQSQHFAFAVGSFVAPLLVKPFLTVDVENYSLDHSRLHIPYLIGGCIAIFGSVGMLVLYCIEKYEKPYRLKQVDLDKLSADENGSISNTRSKKIALVILSVLFMGCILGMEISTIQFLSTFSQWIPLKLSEPNGDLVLSGLTGAFTVGRGIGIYLSLKVLPEFIVAGNFVFILIGNSILMWFCSDSHIALWAGSLILGIGFSTLIPSFYGYLEKYLKVSNLIGGIQLLSGGVMSSIYPLIIGTIIQANPFILMYTNFFSLTVCIVVFIITYFLTRAKSESK